MLNNTTDEQKYLSYLNNEVDNRIKTFRRNFFWILFGMVFFVGLFVYNLAAKETLYFLNIFMAILFTLATGSIFVPYKDIILRKDKKKMARMLIEENSYGVDNFVEFTNKSKNKLTSAENRSANRKSIKMFVEQSE